MELTRYDKERFAASLDARSDAIVQAIQEAVQDGRHQEPDFTGRTSGNVRLDVANARLKQLLDGDEGVSYYESMSTTWFRVDGQLQFSIKSVGENRKPRNHPTKRDEAIKNQLPWPGLDPLHYLFVCYQTDETKSVLMTVDVVAMKGNDIVWRHELFNNSSQQGLPFPAISSTPAQPGAATVGITQKASTKTMLRRLRATLKPGVKPAKPEKKDPEQ